MNNNDNSKEIIYLCAIIIVAVVFCWIGTYIGHQTTSMECTLVQGEIVKVEKNISPGYMRNIYVLSKDKEMNDHIDQVVVVQHQFVVGEQVSFEAFSVNGRQSYTSMLQPDTSK